MVEDRFMDEHTYSHKYRQGEGGTSDYNELENLPKINDVTLAGNKSSSDLGLAAAGDIPTKLSDLINDEGFITSADLPTKVSDLQNDEGFITSADLPTALSDLTNDEGFVADTVFANFYFISSLFNEVSFSRPIEQIAAQVATELGTILASLENNEYITLEQVIITNLVTITPELKVMLKKGNTVPTYRLQGFSFGTNEILFVDLNSASIVRYATVNTTPAADYNEDYTGDAVAYSVKILYNKYQKGL